MKIFKVYGREKLVNTTLGNYILREGFMKLKISVIFKNNPEVYEVLYFNTRNQYFLYDTKKGKDGQAYIEVGQMINVEKIIPEEII